MISTLYLASDGFADLDPGFLGQSVIFLVVTLGAVGSVAGIALVILTVLEKIRGRKNPQVDFVRNPLEIDITQHGPTRREFDALKCEVDDIQKSLPLMERRIIDEIKSGHREMRDMIEKVSTSAYNGRKELHNKHQAMSDRIARVEGEVHARNKG